MAELFSSDSSLLKIQVEDDLGRVTFNLLPSSYLVKISRVSYQTQWISIEREPTIQLQKIILYPNSSSPSAVVVSARRPFAELKPGKTIINVESSMTR